MAAEIISRDHLLRLISTLDAQIADAKALIHDLPIGGPDSNTAAQWLIEAMDARERYRQILRNLVE